MLSTFHRSWRFELTSIRLQGNGNCSDTVNENCIQWCCGEDDIIDGRAMANENVLWPVAANKAEWMMLPKDSLSKPSNNVIYEDWLCEEVRSPVFVEIDAWFVAFLVHLSYRLHGCRHFFCITSDLRFCVMVVFVVVRPDANLWPVNMVPYPIPLVQQSREQFGRCDILYFWWQRESGGVVIRFFMSIVF